MPRPLKREIQPVERVIVAAKTGVRIARNIRSGNEPLPLEMAIAETLAEQLGLHVLLSGRNVPGGDALLATAARRLYRAEFKTLHSSSARAFERNLRDASRQIGKYPGAVVIDARVVDTPATDAETYIDRAIGLVVPRRPMLQEVIVITNERIIHRRLVR
jgi:hypothetical protein